jgi:hypothetical protein
VDLPARKRKEHQCVCLPDPETAVVRAYVSVLADLTMCSSPGDHFFFISCLFLTVPLLAMPKFTHVLLWPVQNSWVLMTCQAGARKSIRIANPDIKIDGYARMSSSFG